jgi:RNA polymerase-binding transcription factor DksA
MGEGLNCLKDKAEIRQIRKVLHQLDQFRPGRPAFTRDTRGIFNCVTPYTDHELEGNSTMQVYKLVMRRSILALLVDRLRASADLEFPEGTRAFDRISTFEIGALFYVRSDPALDELRGALTRLENGTFGICNKCKSRIGWSLLLRDPRKRVCPDCEDEIKKPILEATGSAYPSLESTSFSG